MTVSFATYLSKGAFADNCPDLIYHMCDADEFRSQTSLGGEYLPTTYRKDGFIHATREASMLLTVGNHFYKENKGKWICIEIDPRYVNGRVRYEAPAAVGDKADLTHENKPIFPHIYCGLTLLAVRRILPVLRDNDGTFLAIEGL